MKTYTIYEAKTHLSELIKRAAAGDTVRIGSHGKASVELRRVPVSANEMPKSFFGIWKGKIEFAPDYDHVDQEISDAIMARIGR